MRLSYIGGVLLFPLLVASVHAGAHKKSDKKMVKQVKTDIYYLASDSLEGRRTGSAGERKAGDYIINRYMTQGIPGYKNQYRYPFHFVYGKEIAAATTIRLGDKFMKIKEEAFPLPFSANKKAYSMILPDVMETDNLWMINLYADQDEANNPHFDAEKVMYERAKEAMKHGASGVLFYDGYGSKWPPTFNTQSEYESLEIPVAFLTNAAFNKYLRQDGNDTDGGKLKSGIGVDMNVEIKKTQRVGTNIAAYIDNHAPYTVVVGAHYDHLGRGEDGNSLYASKEPTIHNGADDNASGTSALLNVAGWVKRHKLHHYNYLFVNFSGEELGLLGSKNFVKDQKLDSTHIAYMINMDMVGRLNDSTHALTLGGVGTSPAWYELLKEPNEHFRIIVDSSGIGPSDHTSFYLENIPVLFFFTGTHKDYHKPSDDADKINYEGDVQVINYVDDILKDMDHKPRPAFTPTKQSTLGKVNFKVTLGIMPDYSFQEGGVRIDGVSEGRPAKNAGMKEGDIIIQLGAVKVQGMQSYMEALSKLAPGDKTNAIIMRDGKQLTVPVEFTAPAK